MVEVDFNPRIGEQVEVAGHDGLFEVLGRHESSGGLMLKVRRLKDGKLLENVNPLWVDYPQEERVKRRAGPNLE